MWPFTNKPAQGKSSLRNQSITIQEIVNDAFTSPGPLYSDDRRRIISDWLGNFARNLGAAVTAYETGSDMRGNTISKQQILQGLNRMCNDYGSSATLKRLEDVCGAEIRSRFERVLREVQSLAS